MIENQRREVILVLPYLNINTTSAERFKSFIKAFRADTRVNLRVYQIKYPNTKSYFSGMSLENVDSEDVEINYIVPKLNKIQKFGFRELENGNYTLWKIAHLLHLILYQTDIFYPAEIDSSNWKKYPLGYVIVSGAHFSYFSTARKLAKKLGYKLVIDYRDPWTFGYAPIGGFKIIHWIKILLNRKNELLALKQAGLVSTVSQSLRQFLPDFIKEKTIIIPNGCNFNVEEIKPNSNPYIFNIVYAGTIYNSQLNNEVFFKGLAEFMVTKDPRKVKLQFIGTAQQAYLNNILNKYNLLSIVHYSGRLKKEELKNYLSEASVFLHLKYGDNKDIITSKQADYLAFRKPILLPVSDKGDIAESIINNNAGYVCNTVEENVAVLEMLYDKFKNGKSLVIPQSEEMLRKNSREYIAKEFVEQVLNS